MNELQLRVLEIIKRTDGQYSWYQLDRALSEVGMEHSGKLMHVMRCLVSEGYVRTTEGANPAQPIYWITECGQGVLQQVS